MRNVLTALGVVAVAVAGCSSGSNALGAACTRDPDCASFACINTVCENPVSCAAIKVANPMASDGEFVLDPDGSTGAPPFTAWCDMTSDGGGWTALPLRFSDSALWSITHSGSECTTAPALDNNGSLKSVQNGMAPTMWNYLSMKFVPPIPVKQVWLKKLNHSTSTVCNNMDLTYTMPPAATNDTTAESWYFAGDDPTVPLGYTFADGCNSTGYSDPGAPQPECSMAKPGSDALVTITRQIKLSKQAARFHMVAVQGCGSDPPCDLNGQAERFYINHPPRDGVWTDGILVR